MTKNIKKSNIPDIAWWNNFIKNIQQIHHKHRTAKQHFESTRHYHAPVTNLQPKNISQNLPKAHINNIVLFAHAGIIDTNTAKRMDQGCYQLEATIDLHGCTLQQAFNALHNFLAHQWNLRKRMLLVITGKGVGEHTIKNMFITWLNHDKIRPYVLRVSAAKPKDGGDGAFYILLKQNNNK